MMITQWFVRNQKRTVSLAAILMLMSFLTGAKLSTPSQFPTASQRNSFSTGSFAAGERHSKFMSRPAADLQANAFATIPLSFEANQGQCDPRAKYLSRGGGYALLLTPDEAILKLSSRTHANAKSLSPFDSDEGAMKNAGSTLRMRLVGANHATQIAGVNEQAGKSNYFIGNDPRNWRANVPHYSAVKYRDAYPGIDLVYYGNQRQLEYDFVVAPQADPKSISIEIAAELPVWQSVRNAAPLSISADGDLVVPVADGQVQFHKPVVYQPANSNATPSGRPGPSEGDDIVAARWVIKSGGRVGFELGAHDTNRPLVIDPALSFSTYLGGSEDENTYSIAADASGNVYVTGTTESTDFPTQGAVQASNAGNEDAFVTKLNSTGTALVYSTYLGGAATDFAFSLALNSAGDVYVAGTTQSTDFPTTSAAFQKTCASCVKGVPSAFVTELNASGSALVYSTYLGGTGDSRGYGIGLDSSGAAYITGRTSSTDFPTTSSAFQKTLNGTVNVFVSKLNTIGSALTYSTFLGGSGSDQANGIAVDSAGNAYVGGSSTSTNFPTTTGAFQTTLLGTSNAIVAKLNGKGSALVYSTYLGGNVADTVWGIRVDGTNNVYVAGQTTSTNFPTTAGAFQSVCAGGCASPNAFVTKFNSAGSAPLYSTYLGGTGEQEAFALAIDSSGDAYVTGRTNSASFPLTHGSFQTTFGGVFDAFVTELNPTGAALLYSSYFGGNGSDAGLGIAVDSAKNIYVTGRTYSSNFPTTPSAYAPTCATCSGTGYEDAFIAKLTAGVQVWPLAINFGSQQVGVKSAALTAVLSNSGSAPLGITGFTLGGVDATDFAETNTCGSSLAAGATCKISVTFTPATSGARTATLSISDSASNSPQTVALSGSGTNNSVTITPASLTFPTQLVGTSSTAQNAVLANPGTTSVKITGIAVTGQFTQTNNCGSSLAAAASCTISVMFSPTAQGTDKGAVKVTDNAAGSPQTLTLVGSATVVSLAPNALNFGNQTVGTTSAAQMITVTNHGAAALTIKTIAIAGTGATDFAQTNTCGTSLAAGASCTASVTFTPKGKASFNATFSVADTGGGSPQSAALTGTGD
ncbi:MAG TPA: SBBP repeat-containing protein [Candidatus Sulfotelmatobacter sp.]